MCRRRWTRILLHLHIHLLLQYLIQSCARGDGTREERGTSKQGGWGPVLLGNQGSLLPSLPPSLPPTLLLSHPPGLSLSLFQVVDIFAEYQRQSSDVLSSAPVELRDTGADGTFRLIHSMRLYRTEALKESPTYVNVYAT